jgi:hypothetical protein
MSFRVLYDIPPIDPRRRPRAIESLVVSLNGYTVQMKAPKAAILITLHVKEVAMMLRNGSAELQHTRMTSGTWTGLHLVHKRKASLAPHEDIHLQAT